VVKVAPSLAGSAPSTEEAAGAPSKPRFAFGAAADDEDDEADGEVDLMARLAKQVRIGGAASAGLEAEEEGCLNCGS